MKTQKKTGLTRQSILRLLRQNRRLLDKYSVLSIGLFGSYAIGKQTPRSDVDFLVEFERPTYDNFIGLSRELEILFGRKVEVLTPHGLGSIRIPEVAESIRKVLAYA